MGTNYYARQNECEKCGQYTELHIGKSSWGWLFLFQYNGGEHYKNIEEMKRWLKGKSIYDEYGEKETHKEFWEMVEAKQNDPKNVENTRIMGIERHGKDYGFCVGSYVFADQEFS